MQQQRQKTQDQKTQCCLAFDVPNLKVDGFLSKGLYASLCRVLAVHSKDNKGKVVNEDRIARANAHIHARVKAFRICGIIVVLKMHAQFL